MLPLMSVLLAYASTAASSSVVSRIFTTADFDALPGSFESWTKFLPCKPSQDSSVDLHLVFSQDVDDYEDVKKVANSVIKAFNDSPTAGWHQCFNDVKLLSVGLTMNEDTYDKYQGSVGPNLAFVRTFKNYEKGTWGDVDSFYLMEIDVQPRKSLWLDVLFEQAEGSTVFGSEYIGRQFAQTGFSDDQDKHINGNAVYNVRDQTLQALVSEVEEMTLSAVATASQVLPYDMYLSKLATTIGSKYNSNQNVIANYASTNMVDELFGEEYIQHGARIWNTFKKPVALVVSVIDEDDSTLQEILDVLKTGVNPFTEAVVFQPKGQDRTVGLTKRDGSKIDVKFQTRNNPFSDLCASVKHVQSGHFHFTNTYHTLKESPIHFFEKKGLPAQWFVDSSNSQCADDEACSYRVRRAQAFTGARVNKHFDDLRTTFDKQAMTTFCSQWQQWRESNPVRGFDPMPGPNADDYMAFIENNLEVQSPLLNSAKWHDRPMNIRRKVNTPNKFTRYFVDDTSYHRKLLKNTTTTPTSSPTPTPGPATFEFPLKNSSVEINYIGTDTVTTSCIATPEAVVSNFVAGSKVKYVWFDQTNNEKITLNTEGQALQEGYNFCLRNVKNGINTAVLEADVLNNATGLLRKTSFTYRVNYVVPSNTNIFSIGCKGGPDAVETSTQNESFWALEIDDAALSDCILDVAVVNQYATAEYVREISFPPGSFKMDISIPVTSAAKTIDYYTLVITRATAPRAQFVTGCNETRTFAISLPPPDATSSPGLNLTSADVSPPRLFSNPGGFDVTGPDCWSNGGPCSLDVGSISYTYSVANPPFEGVNISDTICQIDIQVTAPTYNKFKKICCYVGDQDNGTQCNKGLEVVVTEPKAASEDITCTGYSQDPNSDDTVANFTCFQSVGDSNACSRTIAAVNSLGEESESYNIEIQLVVPKEKLPLKRLSVNDEILGNNLVHNYENTTLGEIQLDFETLFAASAYTADIRLGSKVVASGLPAGSVVRTVGQYDYLWGFTNVFIDSSINDEAFSTTDIKIKLNKPANLTDPYNSVWICSSGASSACATTATAMCDTISAFDLTGDDQARFCYQIEGNIYAVRGDISAKNWAEANFSSISNISEVYTEAAPASRRGRSSKRAPEVKTIRQRSRAPEVKPIRQRSRGDGRRLDATNTTAIVTLSNSEYNITIELNTAETGFVYASVRVPSGVKSLSLNVSKIDDVEWTSAGASSSVIESTVVEGKFTYQFTFQDSDGIHTYSVVVLTDPATLSITAQLSCFGATELCPGLISGNAIFLRQTATMTVSLSGTNTDADGNAIDCEFKVSSPDYLFPQVGLTDGKTVIPAGDTSLDILFEVTELASDIDLVGSVVIEPASFRGCQLAEGGLSAQSSIGIYTKTAPLTATVTSYVTASDEIKAVLQVPSRSVVVSGSALLEYPGDLTSAQPELVPFTIASQNTSLEIVFDSFETKVEPDLYAFASTTRQFQLPIVNNAVAAVETFDVQFAASTATVNLTTNFQGGSSAEEPIVVNPNTIVSLTATMSKKPLEGTQLQVTTSSQTLADTDYEIRLPRIESNRNSIGGSVIIKNSVEAGTADESFTVSVQSSTIVNSANVLHFLIKAPVITIASDNFANLQLTEGTTSSPNAFSVNWATGGKFAFYELIFALNFQYAEGQYSEGEYVFITNTAERPDNLFPSQAGVTISDLLSGGNGIVDFGNDVTVTPETVNVNVLFSPAEYNITVANTEITMVTLTTLATAEVGGQLNAVIRVSLPIAIEQNFTYSIVPDGGGGYTESGFVTLPAMNTSVNVPYIPQLSGNFTITIAVATGPLSSFVSCDACESSFNALTVACASFGGDTVFTDDTRSSSVGTADDGYYGGDGWIGEAGSNYTINLLNQRTVNGIKMRGHSEPNVGAVLTYDMEWSVDGEIWNVGLIDATGSRTDSNEAVISFITPPVSALLIRITPKTFNIQPAMRVEVVGCNNNLCNDSSTFTGTYGGCDSYSTGQNNHKYCFTDVVDPDTQLEGNPPFVESVCQVACGNCGLPVTPLTGAPTGAPTDAALTNVNYPLNCTSDPNFETDWAGAYGDCNSYNSTLCTNEDGSPNLFCNYYHCAADGADYYCAEQCNTCASDDADFVSSFERVNCTYYETHQSECDLDTNVKDFETYGLYASELCTLACNTYPKKPVDTPIPACPIEDSVLTFSGDRKCVDYVNDPTEVQYCEFDGADKECPIACGACTNCEALPADTCADNCDNHTPFLCPYAYQATCYCDDDCVAMEDCCPGRQTQCSGGGAIGRTSRFATSAGGRPKPISSHSNGGNGGHVGRKRKTA